MDRTKPAGKPNPAHRKGQGHSSGPVEVSLFSSTRPPRQYFSIHPEWVSENLSIQSMSIRHRQPTIASAAAAVDPLHRRCMSAPPPRTRNPITWENPDMNEIRLRDTQRTHGRGRPKSTIMEKKNGSKPKAQKSDPAVDKSGKSRFEETFIKSTSSPRRRQYFTIHPEWLSESGSVRPVMTYEQRIMTYPPRRCKSAPPPRTRNPITWEFPDRPDRR